VIGTDASVVGVWCNGVACACWMGLVCGAVEGAGFGSLVREPGIEPGIEPLEPPPDGLVATVHPQPLA
jgi:hypothetical protein